MNIFLKVSAYELITHLPAKFAQTSQVQVANLNESFLYSAYSLYFV